jgi:hypothetical protein
LVALFEEVRQRGGFFRIVIDEATIIATQAKIAAYISHRLRDWPLSDLLRLARIGGDSLVANYMPQENHSPLQQLALTRLQL